MWNWYIIKKWNCCAPSSIFLTFWTKLSRLIREMLQFKGLEGRTLQPFLYLEYFLMTSWQCLKSSLLLMWLMKTYSWQKTGLTLYCLKVFWYTSQGFRYFLKEAPSDSQNQHSGADFSHLDFLLITTKPIFFDEFLRNLLIEQ